MKILEKIISWFLTNVQILNTILLIILIASLIDFYNFKLINDTIIPIAYLATLVLLYMAFKESQKSNRMEFGKDIYKKHLNIINEEKNKIFRKNIFKEIQIISPDNFNSVSFKIYYLIDRLKDDSKYSNYINRLKQKDNSLLTCNDTTFLELNNQYKIIFNLMENIMSSASEFMTIFSNIYYDKNYLSDDQINILIREVDNFLWGYFDLCNKLSENEDICNIYFINENYVTSKYENDNLVYDFKKGKYFSQLYPDFFMNPYKVLIKEKKRIFS